MPIINGSFNILTEILLYLYPEDIKFCLGLRVLDFSQIDDCCVVFWFRFNYFLDLLISFSFIEVM